MNPPATSSPGVAPITVSVKQAAQMLGLSSMTVYRLCDAGKIESKYSGRLRLVLVDSLHDYVATLPNVPETAS